MLLKEIVEEADLLVPNALSIPQKIRTINQVQRQLFRDYPQTASYLFYTVQNQGLYDLPAECPPDGIMAVYVDDKPYEYQLLTENTKGNIYTIVGGKLFIQPTPDLVKEAYLLFQSRPKELSEADLETAPEFPVDYHELLILGCAKRLAFISQQYDLSNALEIRYQNLSREATINLSKGKLKKTRVVRRWG